MPDETESLKRRLRELEMELEETRSLSQARSRLLEANVAELKEVYIVLNEKIKDLRRRDARIKAFQEELVRANKLSALGELASSIAHEIKNPLIAIQGFAKRIEQATDPSRVEQYAKIIDGETERLSKVLIKLLDFSRMDTPRKESVNPAEIVDDTLLFLEHHLTRFKGVTLQIDKEERLPPVEVDKIHIQQALVNIIMNAAQAMPQGGVIRVNTFLRDKYAVIAVSDEGPGIAPEDLDKIFESFFTTKAKGAGTGLGLPLSKRLVEANGGRIEVENKFAEEGCTFRIVLPLPEGN